MAGSKGTSAIAVGMMAGGGLFLWSGFHGASVTGSLRDLLSGHQPAGTAVNPLTGGTGGTPAAPAGAGGTPDQAGWAKELLGALGAPQTQANVSSVVAWEQREGGGGANNPLNTTQAMPGATDFNSVGVKNYPSAAEGVAATVTTLHNGQYGDILLYLRSGRGFVGLTLNGLSTWSGGGYSSVGG